MTRPETPFEAASYDLKQFRERRVADRRFSARSTPDRRKNDNFDAAPDAGGPRNPPQDKSQG